MHKYHWRLSEIEEMYPFELDVYSTLLVEYIEMENKAREESQR